MIMVSNKANWSGADLRRANLSGANLRRATIPCPIPIDGRKYNINIKFEPKYLVFRVGCRNFTLEQAISHWGDSEYEDSDINVPSPELGDAYVRTCQFLEGMYQDGLLIQKPFEN